MTPELLHKVDGDAERRLPIEVYGQYSPPPSASTEVSWHRMLFTYRDMSDRLAQAIKSWFKDFKDADPAIRLHSAITSGGYRYAAGPIPFICTEIS